VLSLPPFNFYLGQPLLRRPKQSGSAVASVHYGKFDVNAVGYVRGWDLNTGTNNALERLGGYLNVGLNVNYRVRGNLTAYANLRNALDRRYEEVYGFPAPLLNFVVGMKWSLARAR
jgi:outer membrane cobalamin receptor